MLKHKTNNYIELSINGKHILEHRYVMEKSLGRTLTSKEVVHHKNGDTKDNRIENLEMLTRKAHNQIHLSRSLPKIACEFCNKIFERKQSYINRNKKLNQKNFCSKRCASKWRLKTVDGQLHSLVIKELNFFFFVTKDLNTPIK